MRVYAPARVGRTAFLISSLTVAAVLAAPAALSAKPVRTLVDPMPGVIPAGQACSFDVGLQSSGYFRSTVTEFSDGSVQTISNAYPRFTNLDSGNSIVWHSSYVATDTYYPDENVGTFDVNGRFFVTFFPGDVAFGEVVGDDRLLLGIKGHLQVTYSLDTFAVTSSSLDGSVVADLGALLA